MWECCFKKKKSHKLIPFWAVAQTKLAFKKITWLWTLLACDGHLS